MLLGLNKDKHSPFSRTSLEQAHLQAASQAQQREEAGRYSVGEKRALPHGVDCKVWA